MYLLLYVYLQALSLPSTFIWIFLISFELSWSYKNSWDFMKSTPNVVVVPACLKPNPRNYHSLGFTRRLKRKILGYKGNFYIIELQ